MILNIADLGLCVSKSSGCILRDVAEFLLTPKEMAKLKVIHVLEL